MSNQVEVTIMGQSYLLACPAGGERALHRAVEQVDEEMCAIRDAGRIRARERIAVLAARGELGFVADVSSDVAPLNQLVAALITADNSPAGDGIRVLRNAENLGFVGSCNAGGALARGEFVLFLNNDTLVTAGWWSNQASANGIST